MLPESLRTFQARFLRELFRAPRSGFVLKGGLALNALYGSSRLTMDIDLDFPPQNERTAESLHGQIMRAIRAALTGLRIHDSRISEPRKAEVSPKWKVSGTTPDGAPFNVQVEVSRRPPVPVGGTRQHPVRNELAPGLPVFYVDLYDEATLAAMKLAALLSPNRHAARDIFDLDMLFANGHRPDRDAFRTLMTSRTPPAGEPADEASRKIAAFTWQDYVAQVQPALEADEAARIDADEWMAMKDRVADIAREWLRETQP